MQQRDHRQLVLPTNLIWTNQPKWNCKSCKDRYANHDDAYVHILLVYGRVLVHAGIARGVTYPVDGVMTKCQQECVEAADLFN